MDFFSSNIEVLKKYHPQVFNRIDQRVQREYELVTAKSGHITVKIDNYFLHSKYNPLQEAKKFIDVQWKDTEKLLLLYGFGFGYHVREALQRISPGQLLYVFELNTELFTLALRHVHLADVLAHPSLRLFVSNDESYIAGKMSEQLKKPNLFIIYPPAARAVPEQFDYFKFILESWDKRLNQVEKYAPLLKQNYEENRKHDDPQVSALFASYKDKPIIVISAGPSLNKNKHLLANCKDKALLFAVGSALKPVLGTGTIPDLFCIIDPIHETTFKQIEGYEDLGIPFVYLETASARTVAAYKGPRFVASNTREHVQREDDLIETGGSVATAVLDIAIKMGGNPIVFVGQDLAFTNNEHHADGRMYGGSPTVEINPTMKKVKGHNGETLATSIGLLSYKYWIEQRIKREPHITFINATEGGAYIEGCTHLPLQEVIEKYIV